MKIGLFEYREVEKKWNMLKILSRVKWFEDIDERRMKLFSEYVLPSSINSINKF